MVALCDVSAMSSTDYITPGTEYYELKKPLIGPTLDLAACAVYLMDLKDKVRELYGSECEPEFEKKIADDEPLNGPTGDLEHVPHHFTKLIEKDLICPNDGFEQTRLVLEVYNKPTLTEDDYDTLVSFTVCGLLSEEHLKKKKEKFQFYRSDGISFPHW